ncbi:MAG TPA: phosphate ABC transporter ATP-binding protein [Methanothrix sp.]|nr:phosphate ABC transporter ATP-binding protein [Methanothrix sp.]
MALLSVTGLGKSCGRAEILKGIDLSVERGEVLGLIGPTGSGKTTLLRLINLLDEPSCGCIEFDGRTVSGLPEKEMLAARRRMGMVFQKPVMFSASVQDNVSYGLRVRGARRRADGGRAEIEERVRLVLEAVGLEGCERRDASTLSGGEMQRIALARALIIQPELLLLDEPTANLDPRSADSIDRLLERLAGSGLFLGESDGENRNSGDSGEDNLAGRPSGTAHRPAVILATHNMRQCRRLAGRVAVLQAGRLAAIGCTEEIFRERDGFIFHDFL